MARKLAEKGHVGNAEYKLRVRTTEKPQFFRCGFEFTPTFCDVTVKTKEEFDRLVNEPHLAVVDAKTGKTLSNANHPAIKASFAQQKQAEFEAKLAAASSEKNAAMNEIENLKKHIRKLQEKLDSFQKPSSTNPQNR